MSLPLLVQGCVAVRLQHNIQINAWFDLNTCALPTRTRKRLNDSMQAVGVHPSPLSYGLIHSACMHTYKRTHKHIQIYIYIYARETRHSFLLDPLPG